MDDSLRLFAKFEAAVYLYQLTGEPIFKGFVESNYTSILPSSGPTVWNWDPERQESLLHYARLPGISVQVRSAISTKFIAGVTGNADQLPMVTDKKDPYRAPINTSVWGSNLLKAEQARLYVLLALYGDDVAIAAVADSAALGYIHYIHGVNPLGLVYLTNMRSAGAKHSAITMFHNWFNYNSARWSKVSDAMPGPPPGYLVGGPNPSYSLDKCCTAAIWTPDYRCSYVTHPAGIPAAAAFALCRGSYAPPIGQPPLKSYRQFNEGWPVNSWEITEPSIGYQAQYILVLARYVR